MYIIASIFVLVYWFPSACCAELFFVVFSCGEQLCRSCCPWVRAYVCGHVRARWRQYACMCVRACVRNCRDRKSIKEKTTMGWICICMAFSKVSPADDSSIINATIEFIKKYHCFSRSPIIVLKFIENKLFHYSKKSRDLFHILLFTLAKVLNWIFCIYKKQKSFLGAHIYIVLEHVTLHIS